MSDTVKLVLLIPAALLVVAIGCQLGIWWVDLMWPIWPPLAIAPIAVGLVLVFSK